MPPRKYPVAPLGVMAPRLGPPVLTEFPPFLKSNGGGIRNIKQFQNTTKLLQKEQRAMKQQFQSPLEFYHEVHKDFVPVGLPSQK